MIQRGGQVVIPMPANVKQATIKPLVTATMESGPLVYTHEYVIYNKLPEWGYGHKSVCHGDGQYARDEDGDGFHEVHVYPVFWRCCLDNIPESTKSLNFS